MFVYILIPTASLDIGRNIDRFKEWRLYKGLITIDTQRVFTLLINTHEIFSMNESTVLKFNYR